jgi:hypothetical protein
MLGYEAWEQLVAACSSGNPKVTFDQDLSEDAFAKRLAGMAYGLSKGLGMVYQDAYDVVEFVTHAEYLKHRRAVLVPHGFKKPWTRHANFRVGELMAFEEQPMEWMLRAPSSHPRQANDWLKRRYPNATKEEAKILLRSRVDDLHKLRKMAGISKRPSRVTIATVAAREAGGAKWHWPLVPLDHGQAAMKQAEAIAREEQLRLDREAGMTVFSVYQAD